MNNEYPLKNNIGKSEAQKIAYYIVAIRDFISHPKHNEKEAITKALSETNIIDYFIDILYQIIIWHMEYSALGENR